MFEEVGVIKLTVAAIMVGTLATPAYGQGSVGQVPEVDDRLFQCGAAFAIMSEVYKAAGNAELSTSYALQFNRLAEQAEGIFARSNRSKSDAQAYMQRHVQTLSAVADKDAKLVIGLAQVCEQRYRS
ncbi:hypothetical protein [Rhizobium sp. HT1-10]|uniref:hypothetical protein n=1 Tax=Rhizobium sp. HT1-10 TaxID=3111638 RepID=UPI003C1ADACA